MKSKLNYDKKSGVLQGGIIDKQTGKVCVEKGQQIKFVSEKEALNWLKAARKEK